MIRISIQPKILDPDPYQMNTGPKHWFIIFAFFCVGEEDNGREHPWEPAGARGGLHAQAGTPRHGQPAPSAKVLFNNL